MIAGLHLSGGGRWSGDRLHSKARRAWAKLFGVLCREPEPWGFDFTFRVCSLCIRRRERSFRRASCRRGRRVRVRLPLCSSAARRGRLLAPSRPPINRSFSVASGCFRSQTRQCDRWPFASRAKGGQRWLKPALSYILATYFVSASVSMERVKGIEPSSQAWEAHILPLNHTRARLEQSSIKVRRPVQPVLRLHVHESRLLCSRSSEGSSSKISVWRDITPVGTGIRRDNLVNPVKEFAQRLRWQH